MSDLDIVPVDPLDQDLVKQWLELLQAAQDADAPHQPRIAPAPSVLGLLRQVSYRRTERWVARRDGRVVGAAEITMFLSDNQHLADVELTVAPDLRRQGIGTALLGHVEQRVAAEGRDTLIGYAVDPLAGGAPRPDHGQRFAEAAGYARGLDEVHRVADLTTVAEPDLTALLDDAWRYAEGYELVHWEGTKPAEILAGAAYLNARMNVDAPVGDLDIREGSMTAQQMRDREEHNYLTGMLELGTVVRHRDSGEVAGYTEIHVVAGDEEHCWQGNTIVDPGHRGKRLGTIIKIENQRLLRAYRPRMRYVHTFNAEENAHMIAINEAIGYRAVDRWIAYQKKLSG